MPDILILPQRGTSNNPSMHFTGSGLANIKMEVLPSGSVAYIGTSGSLFNITDSLIGSLMAVGDVSGLPIFEVFSDDRVVMGKYGKNTVYVSGANVGIGKVPLNAVLDVSGSVSVSGSLNVTSSLNLMGGAGSQLNGNGSTLSLSISGNWNSSVSSLIQLTSSDLNFWTNAGTFRFKNSSGTDVATLTNAGKLSILNGGTGTTNAPLQVAGDIVTYRSSTSGVIYFGTSGDRYLHYDGSNYYMPNGQLYVNGTQVVLNSGTWSINVSGTAASETLSTVTSRGASTAYQISVSTSAGGSMFTGTKGGSGYSDGVSGATFKSITENPNGGSYAFAAYYNGSGGTNSYWIASTGESYFRSRMLIGGTTTYTAGGSPNITVVKTSAGANAVQLELRNESISSGTATSINFMMTSADSSTPNSRITATRGTNFDGTLEFYVSNGLGTLANAMYINSSANVGIGTTSPSSKLSVNGAADIGAIGYTPGQTGILQIGSTSYNYLFTQGTWSSDIRAGILANCSDNWEFAIHDSGHRVVSPFAFFGGSSNYFQFGRDIGWGTSICSFAGSVGVGTTSPSYKLDVSGDIRTTTNLTVSNGIGANAANDAGNNLNGGVALWSSPGSTTSLTLFKNWASVFGRAYTALTESNGYATYHLMDSAGRGWVWRYVSGGTSGTNVASIRNDTGTMTLGASYDWSNGYYAQLNISAGQGAASTYRDIDMHGSWASGEGHAITATHGGGSSNIVGQIVFQHDSPGSRIRFGRLYHSGDQSGYPMELISTGANTAKLEISGDVVADNVFNPFLLMGA